MKNKDSIWYAGYGIALALVILLIFTEFNFEIDLLIGIVFSVIFVVSHVQLLHNHMLRDEDDYKRNVFDERNIVIREKAGNVMNMITLILLGFISVLFIALDYIIPAIIIGGIVFVQPIILNCISKSIEKKM